MGELSYVQRKGRTEKGEVEGMRKESLKESGCQMTDTSRRTWTTGLCNVMSLNAYPVQM